MKSGREIIIEQRPSWEACTVRGRIVDVNEMARTNGLIDLKVAEGQVEVTTVLITPPNTRTYNPAFDVVPAKLIDGIVTEVGVAYREENGEYDLTMFVKGAK